MDHLPSDVNVQHGQTSNEHIWFLNHMEEILYFFTWITLAVLCSSLVLHMPEIIETQQYATVLTLFITHLRLPRSIMEITKEWLEL